MANRSNVIGSVAAGALSAVLFIALATAAAGAADLGGDCCADLEERVAELEATAATKGNRKMSLSIYGRVHKGLIWFDNGIDSDVYAADMDFSGSRVGFEGVATLRPQLSVGFKVQMYTQDQYLSGLTEDDGITPEDPFGIDYAYWYAADDKLGTLTVGYADSAADATAEQDLSGAANWFSYNNWVTDATSSFHIADGSTGTYPGPVWADVMDVLDAGTTASVVRYDSPAISGFTLSASWGTDDRWDGAVVYSYESEELEFAAAVGYSAVDENQEGVAGPLGSTDTLSSSASIYLPGSGLYAVLAYSTYDAEGSKTGPADDLSAANFYAKLGIRRKWNDLGETSLFVDYQRTADYANDGSVGNGWGFGVAQALAAIDGAAYIGFRHSTAEGVDGIDDPQAMNAVVSGLMVQF